MILPSRTRQWPIPQSNVDGHPAAASALSLNGRRPTNTASQTEARPRGGKRAACCAAIGPPTAVSPPEMRGEAEGRTGAARRRWNPHRRLAYTSGTWPLGDRQGYNAANHGSLRLLRPDRLDFAFVDTEHNPIQAGQTDEPVRIDPPEAADGNLRPKRLVVLGARSRCWGPRLRPWRW